MSNALDDPSLDGRTARRERNRDAVLDAVVELVAELGRVPTAAEAAERSGVSLRSVYRYFDDLDGLALAATARYVSQVDHLFEPDHPGVGPLHDRIARFVDSRLRVHDVIAPVTRVVLARLATSPVLAAHVARRRAAGAAHIPAMFPTELDAFPPDVADEVVAAIDTLTQFESLEHLTVRRSLSTEQARSVLERSVAALLRT